MKYLRGCLLIMVSLCYSPLVFAGEMKNIPVAPPELVRCESNAHCDHEPKRLEQFVTGFYRWYIDTNRHLLPLEWENSKIPKIKERYRQRIEQESATLGNLVTPRFAAQIQNVPFAQRNKLFFYTDSLHVQWKESMLPINISVKNALAELTIILPASPEMEGFETGMSIKLNVTLRPSQGDWKIDGVKRVMDDAGTKEYAKHEFRRPETEPEKALDSVLELDKQGPAVVWYLISRNPKNMSPAPFFTAAYHTAVADAEAKEVDKNCGGHYVDGDECGLGFSPLTCAQDIPLFYLYRTLEADKSHAIIASEWPWSWHPSAIYRMRYEDGQWKVDGVGCEDDLHIGFNMQWHIEAPDVDVASPPFHTAENVPEKQLDAILTRVDNDNLLTSRLYSEGKKYYSDILTPALLASLAKAEKEEVQSSCGGIDSPEGVCGMDFDPISCGQDKNDTYLYRTEKMSVNEAIISYTWPRKTKSIASYRLTKDGKGWRMDGIDCGDGVEFNILHPLKENF